MDRGMGIMEISGIGFGATKKPAARAFVSAEAPSRADQVIAEFRKEARKTPMERIRDTILKKHNLTPEQFDALQPELKAAIQREIEEAMKRAIKGGENGAAATGSNANVLV
jgi:hypothetical protein